MALIQRVIGGEPAFIQFERDGMFFLINPCDEFMIAEQSNHLQRRKGELKTALDIGAHVGTFALQAAKRGAKVLAVEPSKRNFSALLDNIHVNGFEDEVHGMCVAVYTETGLELPLRSVSNHRMYGTGQRSLCFTDSYNVSDMVRTISLTHLLEDAFKILGTVDCLKMDIEGAEFVLAGNGPEPLLGMVGYITIELHPPNNQSFFPAGDERPDDECYGEIISWLKDSGVQNAHVDKWSRAVGGREGA